jgi:Tfp pilus assembly protein PilF
MTQERASRFIVLVCAVVIAAAYANSLRIGFHFDDAHTLADNPHIRSLTNIPRFFWDANTSSVLPQNRDLRPILLTTFALNYAISGEATWSYHVVNLLLHWLVVVLIFRIVRDHLWLGENGLSVGAAAALVVAAHPLNTEPLNYLSARSALLTAVFYLGAFDVALRKRYTVSFFLFAAALLTKAIAATFPVVLLGYWLLARRQRRRGEPWCGPWGFLVALLVLDAAAGLYRWWLVPDVALESTREVGMTPVTYFMTGWSAYLYYLRLFLWPNALVIDRKDYEIVHSFLQVRACGSLAVLVTLGVLAWRARNRWPALSFAALWYFVTLAAESTFFPLAEPVNEHRPYLAMLGLGTAAGFVLWRLATLAAGRYQAPPAWVFAILVTFATAVLGATTVGRNQTWRDARTLWTDATVKAPDNHRAWLNAGHAALVSGDLVEARALLTEALRRNSCYAYVLINLSVVERRTGKLEDSLRWADEAVRCNPRLALTHHYRGAALERLDRIDEALDEYRQTTALDPHHADAWLAQARLLEQRGDWAEAAAAYDRTLEANPFRTEAAMLAGLLHHYQLQHPAVAVEYYRIVLRLVPTHYGAHYQLAVALLASGMEREALTAWRAFERLAEDIGDRKSLDGAPEAFRTAAAGSGSG